MNRNPLFLALKGLSCLFVLLYFYPFFFLVNSVLSPEDGVFVSLLETGSLLLPGGVGLLLGYGLAKTKFSTVKKNLVRFCVALPVAAATFAAFYALRTVWIGLAAAILAGAAYWVGYTLAFAPYGQILSGKRYIFLIGLYAAAILVAWLLKLPTGAQGYTGLLLAGTAVYLAQANQSNIDWLMQRRRHPLSQLPEKIRRYNLLLVGGVFLALLALFLLKDWVIFLLGGAGELLRRGFVFLLSLLQGDAQEPPPQEEEPSAPGGNEQLPLEPGEANPVVQAVLSLAIAALFLFLVFYYRKELASLFRGIYRNLRDFVFRLLHREHAFQRVDASSEYYVDSEETLLPAEYQEPKRRESNGMRQWRKDYKNYCRMPAGPGKLRQGYGLVLTWLSLHKLPLLPADTTLEILEKSAQAIPQKELEPPTATYNALRYGEREIPLESLSQIDAVLERLRAKG